MSRLLEKSDFFRILFAKQKLSDRFYQFNMTIQERSTSLLLLLFSGLENELCFEDALKCLIATIKI